MNSSNQTVAIVTGGGSGIGLAIAEKFVQHNITTVIVGRDQEKLHQAKQNLGNLCVPIAADLSDLEAIPTLVKQIITQLGHIDILVNNAG
ncbi:MAG: SDR family oxidoreductase, partial [Niastella sp.]|uniref:SDR family oxidoreductase n=1 Tax=Niastella sp. TaxID=1869183 RepID=UPI00389A5A3A